MQQVQRSSRLSARNRLAGCFGLSQIAASCLNFLKWRSCRFYRSRWRRSGAKLCRYGKNCRSGYRQRLRASLRSEHRGDRFRADRCDHASLGDDAGNERSRRDVESRVPHVDSVRHGLFPEAVADFIAGPLFDGNEISRRQAQIKSARRCGHIKGDTVGFGQNGDRVGSDFVGRVTVGGDPVGTGDDRLYFLLAHDQSSHRVTNHGHRDVALLALPGGQASPL